MKLSKNYYELLNRSNGVYDALYDFIWDAKNFVQKHPKDRHCMFVNLLIENARNAMRSLQGLSISDS